MEPLNNGHVGDECFVHFSEVVPSLEVRTIYRQGTNALSIVGMLSTLWCIHYQRFHCCCVQTSHGCRSCPSSPRASKLPPSLPPSLAHSLPPSLTIGISLEEDGLSLKEKNNPHRIWSLRSPGILGTQELIGFVHRLKSLLPMRERRKTILCL